MPSIEIDFEVYKALTMLREVESQSYNDVIRILTNLQTTQAVTAAVIRQDTPSSLIYRGVEFPNGTQFRATYKGKTYHGQVKDGIWIDSDGRLQTSPSQAAYNITQAGVNGWKFWECSRPSAPEWVILDSLR